MKSSRTLWFACVCAFAALAAFATVPISAAESSYPLEGGMRSFVETNGEMDVVNTFSESGTLTVAVETTVRALFVAGGGGGGYGVGGGGGGGGVVALNELVLAPGVYTVTVGSGGNGGYASKPYGINGGDTTLTLDGAEVSESLPAIGGGFGVGWGAQLGPGSGGSGGASCGGKVGADGTPGQGYAGGKSGSRSSGGGGGAGGPGGDGDTLGTGVQKAASAVGGAGFVSDISGSSVAYGGGGGGGGGDGGACPCSPGTDGGGDGTDFNAALAAGDGEDGRGGGGGGSGYANPAANIKPGGRGGSGIVILRYSVDPSMLAEPTVNPAGAVADIKSVTIDFDVVSFGRDASSLTILMTATPADGGAVVSGAFPVTATGVSSFVLKGLRANIAYTITAIATNDRDVSTAFDVGAVVPYARAVSATGGDEVFEKKHRRIHVFTQDGTFEVSQSGFVDILVVGGGGSGGTSVGGGGGGGGVVWKKGVALAVGTYNVSVGAGGVPADYVSDLNTPNGTNGGDSSFDEIVAYGGGAGASWSRKSGNVGGSGGGGCGGNAGAAGIEGQGYAGGKSGPRSSSGGGGAGGPGGDGGAGASGIQKPASAVGGEGLACDITGETVRYGGGGGGGGGDGGTCPGSPGTDGGGDGTDYNGGAGGDGMDGRGAGGGGSGYADSSENHKPGGRGGSGVVIVAYDLAPSGFMVILR